MRRIALGIPTLLSVLRLILTVPAAIAILQREWGTALAVSMIAGFTDTADGWIARRFRLMTRAGAWADPIADKALLVTIYVCLAVTGVVPAWLVWLVLGRDILILAMAGYALAFTPFRDFPPSVWGKVSTVLQVLTAIAAMGVNLAPERLDALLDALLFATAAGTLGSGAHYFWSGVQRLRELSGNPIDRGGARG